MFLGEHGLGNDPCNGLPFHFTIDRLNWAPIVRSKRSTMLDQDLTTPPKSMAERSALHMSWLQPPGLLALSATNFILRFLTLGIYSFWGKTEVRKRIWSAIRIEGEPLHYTGTGKELFLGFLVIFGLILLPITLTTFGLAMYFGPESPANTIFSLLMYPVIFILIGIGTYRAQRYRLTRTHWRGIRGGLVGSDLQYAWTYFWSALLLPATLGWIAPWRSTELQKILTRDMRFGDRAFTFTAKPGPLYGSFSVLWFATLFIVIAAISVLGFNADLPTFDPEGMAEGEKDPVKAIKFVALLYAVLMLAFFSYYVLSAWYRSKAINHFAAHTHFEGATFKSTVTGIGLVRVAVGNFLLNVLGWSIGLALFAILVTPVAMLAPDGTFASGAEGLKFAAITVGVLVLVASSGLFAPVIQSRTMRYLVQNLSIDGTVPLGDIAQGEAQKLTRGEGLAQAFDIDGF